MPDNPHAVDVHVGNKVRERRVALGLTQSDLAMALGLTFQQIQKYERGANRISASKMWDIAVALGVTIDVFFIGLPGADEKAYPDSEEFAPTALTIEIGRRARQLTTPRQRLTLALMQEWRTPENSASPADGQE